MRLVDAINCQQHPGENDELGEGLLPADVGELGDQALEFPTRVRQQPVDILTDKICIQHGTGGFRNEIEFFQETRFVGGVVV
jgi:hypothetical protein